MYFDFNLVSKKGSNKSQITFQKREKDNRSDERTISDNDVRFSVGEAKFMRIKIERLEKQLNDSINMLSKSNKTEIVITIF